MASAEDPAIPRRRLKGELRAARTDSGMTREVVAAELDWSLSKIVRIETGDQGVSVTDLRALLQLYGVTDENIIQELTEMARASRGQTWWGSYRDVVSKPYGQLLGFEGSASEIRTFHPLNVPGLLHTDDYAFESLRAQVPEQRARRIVDLRMERQERFFEQSKPPQAMFILCEEALYRWIGGAAVMRRQLQSLLDISGRTNVSIRLVPFRAGAHPGMIGPFILLSLKDSSDDLLFLEGAGGDLASRDDQDMIELFTGKFETLRTMALSEAETKAVIERRMDYFSQEEGAPPVEAASEDTKRSTDI